MNSLAQRVLSTLVAHNVLAEAQGKGDDPGYLPGRSLDNLSLAQVVRALRREDGEAFPLKHGERYTEVAKVLEQAEEASAAVLGAESLRDRLRPPSNQD